MKIRAHAFQTICAGMPIFLYVGLKAYALIHTLVYIHVCVQTNSSIQLSAMMTGNHVNSSLYNSVAQYTRTYRYPLHTHTHTHLHAQYGYVALMATNVTVRLLCRCPLSMRLLNVGHYVVLVLLLLLLDMKMTRNEQL